MGSVYGGVRRCGSGIGTRVGGSRGRVSARIGDSRAPGCCGIRAGVDTYDFDAQYNFAAGPQHAIVVGGGYRVTDDTFVPGPGTSSLNPPHRLLGLGNVFAQMNQKEDAIHAYRRALTLNPEDEAARHNLEVLLSKKQPPQPKEGADEGPTGDKMAERMPGKRFVAPSE